MAILIEVTQGDETGAIAELELCRAFEGACSVARKNQYIAAVPESHREVLVAILIVVPHLDGPWSVAGLVDPSRYEHGISGSEQDRDVIAVSIPHDEVLVPVLVEVPYGNTVRGIAHMEVHGPFESAVPKAPKD